MSWTEVASGGPTTGRYRYVRDSINDDVWLLKRSTVNTSNLWYLEDGSSTATNIDGPDYAGTVGDEYFSLGIFGNAGPTDNLLYIGGEQDNITTDSAHHGYALSASAKLSSWSTRGLYLVPAVGNTYGHSRHLVTHSGVNQWVFRSYGGASDWEGLGSGPGSDPTVTVVDLAAGSSVDEDEGCFFEVPADTRLYMVMWRTTATPVIRIASLDSVGANAVQTTPTSWVNTDTIEIGQCFALGAKAVVVVYNATRDETYVGIVSDTTIENAQTLSGQFVGGATVDGVGYIAKTTGEVYSSDGTGDFTDISDDLPTTTLILTPSPDGTTLYGWPTDGKAYEYAVSTASGPALKPFGKLPFGALPFGKSPFLGGAFTGAGTPALSQVIQNYTVLGNGWDASSGSTAEKDFFIGRYSMCQEFRVASGEALVTHGATNVLKYRLGSGAFGDGSQASENDTIFDRVKGLEASPYNVDIRMPSTLGGFMVSDSSAGQINYIDVLTYPDEFADILNASLEPTLEDNATLFDGVFLDVAGVYVLANYDEGGQHEPDLMGYTRLGDQGGWADVYNQIRLRFPSKLVCLNCHRPFHADEDSRLTGLKLMADSNAHVMMSEKRGSNPPGVSSWMNETILDVESALAAGHKVVMTFQYDLTEGNAIAQREYNLAAFLVACGSSTDAWFGMQNVIDDTMDEIADFPEQTLDILATLGASTSGVQISGGVYYRTFESGEVYVHGDRKGVNESITIAASRERLDLTGGGAYPGGGSIAWNAIASGATTINVPEPEIGANSSYIVKAA